MRGDWKAIVDQLAWKLHGEDFKAANKMLFAFLVDNADALDSNLDNVSLSSCSLDWPHDRCNPENKYLPILISYLAFLNPKPLTLNKCWPLALCHTYGIYRSALTWTYVCASHLSLYIQIPVPKPNAERKEHLEQVHSYLVLLVGMLRWHPSKANQAKHFSKASEHYQSLVRQKCGWRNDRPMGLMANLTQQLLDCMAQLLFEQIAQADDPIIAPVKGSLMSRIQKAKAGQNHNSKSWFDFNLVR